MENPDQETLERWHKDPNNWKWGLFYYNPDDKRIFPPKRAAWMGFTLNFSNRKSVLVFLMILALIVGLLYFLPAHK